MVADLTIEPKGSGEKTETSLEVTLSKVNEKVAIKAPAGAKPLTDLFGELGISLNQLGGLLEGGGTEGLGGLLEGIIGGSGLGGESSSGGGESSSGGGAEEAELPLVAGIHRMPGRSEGRGGTPEVRIVDGIAA